MELVLVSESEVAELAELAISVWGRHYTPLLGAEQVRYMLDRFLTADVIRTQIADKGYYYFFMRDGGENIGFLAYYFNDGLFLSKLYVLEQFRGKGFARSAIEKLKNVCRQNGLHRIWLQVYVGNTNSINAYYAMGFEKMYDKVTDIGNGYVMDDHFLELRVAAQ